MPTSIPTLGGWITTVEKKADYALSCFLTSEYSQSVLYEGNIASLQYLVQRFGDDKVELQANCRDTLQGLMERYFTNANVTVKVDETDPDNPGQLFIQFACMVRDGLNEYNLGRRVQFVNGALQKIIDINNGETP